MIGLLRTNVKKPGRRQRAIPTPFSAPAARGRTRVGAATLAKARDPVLVAQIQAEASLAASLAAQQNNLQIAGACLHEPIRFSDAPNGLNGLAADLSNLFDSFQTLSGDPANLPLRRSVVRSAQDVAAQFNRASSRLNALQFDLNASIRKDVARANQVLIDIADLNRQIMITRASGGTAGPLAGRRDQLLERLSGGVDIIATPRPDGSVNVGIGGVTMVSGAETPDKLTVYPDKNGNLRVQARYAGTRLKLSGGGIAGIITARDGGLAGLQRGLNNLASQLITRVNAIYNSGRGWNGGTGRDFFTGTGASDISVNCTVANDPSRLQTGAVPGADRDNAVALALAELGSRNVSGLGNRTFGQCYVQTVSDLDHTLSNVNDNLCSSRAVKQMLAHERVAARGVSLDGEMTDLTRYQQAGAVFVRVIAMLDEMLPMR
jgi:flagellar hook-associated protein 1